MAFEQANDPASIGAPGDHRRAWMNAARVIAGATSLTAAFAVGMYYAHERVLFILFITGGLAFFIAMMLGLGRDVSRRWIEFGAALGFRPGARRPVLEMGTDRPTLHGNTGHHPTRLRLVPVRTGARTEEWLQAEVDLFTEPGDARIQERANSLGVQVRDGRLYVRVVFFGHDEIAARDFLAYVARIADVLVHESPA